MKKVTVVISTFGDRVFNIKLPDEIDCVDYLIVHQVGSIDYDVSSRGYPFFNRSDVVYFKSDSEGLSKSRNVGISMATSDYIAIMDDDVKIFPNNILAISERMKLENSDVATARFKFPDGNLARKYSNRSFRHGLISLARVSSIEICLKKSSIIEKNIIFDESFGLGTDFPSGEEYIFLSDCLKSKLNVLYIPITIGIHPFVTSGMDFYSTENKIKAKSAMFKRIFKHAHIAFIFMFWLKKLPILIKNKCFLRFTLAFFGLKKFGS